MKKGFVEAIEDGKVTIFFEDNSKLIVDINEVSGDLQIDDIILYQDEKNIINQGKDESLLDKIKLLSKKTVMNKENKKLRIGVIGPGKIAHTVFKYLQSFPQFELEAVASRDLIKAKEFQKEFAIKKAYFGYEALFQDPDVDLVYIATPHSFHYEQMKQALSYNKNILCEKAFCLELDQIKEIYQLSEKQNVFVGEALVPAFLPGMRIIKNIIQLGKIGVIHHAKAVFGANIKAVPRVIQKKLGGGAMYDIGIYPLYFFYYLFGNQATIKNVNIKWENDVDVAVTFDLQYDNIQANVQATVEEDLGMYAIIEGSLGSIYIENVARPEKVIIYNLQGEVVETIDDLRSTSGYEFEFLAAKEAIEQQKIQTKSHTHQDGIQLYSWIFQILKETE